MAANLEQTILDFVKKTGPGVSFVELSRLEGFYGNATFGVCDHNLIYWQCISKTFADALSALISSGRLEMRRTSLMVYLIDGRLLNLPIAKKFRKYAKMRWFPVSFHLPRPKTISRNSQHQP